MKKIPVLAFILLIGLSAFRSNVNKPDTNQDVIFAVVDDGTVIEPVARLENGQLVAAIDGSEDEDKIRQFTETHYKAGTTYSILSGGKPAGTVSVTRSLAGTECGGITAQVTSKSPRIKLKGFEMALATKISPPASASGVRRNPVATEKAAIDKLAIAEYKKLGASVKGMVAQKVTVLDVNNDKQLEFVATYIVKPSATERGLLFLVAGRSASGTYTTKFSSYNKVMKEEIMSGEVQDVDGGIYQEFLLDVLDINADGVAEIFTVKQSFEGVGYSVYQRKGDQWNSILEVNNYHCAY